MPLSLESFACYDVGQLVFELRLKTAAVRYAATAGPHRVRRNALSTMVGAARNLGPPTHAH
jgi:hypothetical protein